MKYSFQGSFVQATAETIKESLELIKLGDPTLEKTSAAIDKMVGKEVTPPKKIFTRGKKEDLKILKDQLDQITPGFKGFITTEMGRASKNFPSFASHYFKDQKHTKASIHKVYGGYEVHVKV